MKITTKIKNDSTVWFSDLRPRVGDVVSHQGNYFQNTTGINKVPQVGVINGWIFIGSENPINQVNLKIISKGPGNIQQGIQPGDIVCGMLDDNVTFIPFGKYLGNNEPGDFQNVENYSTNPLEF
jgi:hypothetical protein